MSSEPVVTCLVCGAIEWVKPDGRGYPPNIARRRLAKRCATEGHTCKDRYTAGFRLRHPGQEVRGQECGE